MLKQWCQYYSAEISALESFTVTGPVPISQHRSPSRSQDQSRNHGTGVRSTGSVPILWCQNLGTGVRHSHRTGLRSMGPVQILQCQYLSTGVCHSLRISGPLSILRCQNLGIGVRHGAEISASESVTVTAPASRAQDRTKKYRAGTDIMVPISRHRSPSQC